jgi:sulfonate transport system ATP-binding protein
MGPTHVELTPSGKERIVSQEEAAATVPGLGAAISLMSVCKDYGENSEVVRALESVDLHVGFGEFLCIVGASGCGKSTLLNLVAGLDQPTSGSVEVRGGRATLLFQEAALFPWLTVSGNIDLALKLRGFDRAHRKQTVDALVEMVHLTGFGDKRPHELSGGMRQRVALARALAQQAEVLLMDEPFGALDAMTADLLHRELENLWEQTGLTIVFVTHNVQEAVHLADRVVVLSSRPGRVIGDFRVDFQRPRGIDTPEVERMAADIINRLRQEVRRHASDTGRP